jgi:hypothetical protein
VIALTPEQNGLRNTISFSRRHIEPLIGLVEDKKVSRDITKSDKQHEPVTVLGSLIKRAIRDGRNRRDAETSSMAEPLSKRAIRDGRNRRDAEPSSIVEPLSKRAIRDGRDRRDAVESDA